MKKILIFKWNWKRALSFYFLFFHYLLMYICSVISKTSDVWVSMCLGLRQAITFSNRKHSRSCISTIYKDPVLEMTATLPPFTLCHKYIIFFTDLSFYWLFYRTRSVWQETYYNNRINILIYSLIYCILIQFRTFDLSSCMINHCW